MAASKSDSSAPRNNPRVPHRTNDTVDADIIQAVFSLWDGEAKLDSLLSVLKREHLAKVVERGFRLRDASPATWESFLNHPFWQEHPKQKPTESTQVDAVKYVLRVYYGNHPHSAKKANEAWIAVQELERENDDTTAIVQALVDGESVRKLCAKAADRNRGAAKATEASVAPSPSPIAQDKESDASRKRQARVDEQGVTIEFPRGLPGLENLKLDQEYKITMKLIAGGGAAYTATAVKSKLSKTRSKPA